MEPVSLEAIWMRRPLLWPVTAVAGRSTDLPCYLNPRTPGDRPKLILWYKRGVRTPVYSYDDRTAQQHLGIREEAVTLTSRGAATITIKRVQADSAGLYECRVDFFRSPTHNSFVNLTVIEPPRNVEIADSQSGTSDDGIVGPYYENQEVILNCFSRSGTPLPNVTWWRGERVLDGGWEVAGPGLVRNTLVIDRITRDWHNSTLTCTASNTHLASPAVASVVVHMFLLPTSVIITNPGPTREGQRTALTCSARGSRPLADLSWSVRGRTLDAVKVGDDLGLTSTSTLLLNVTREEDGTRVVCTATNPAQPDTPLSNTTTLVVHSLLTCHLRLHDTIILLNSSQ
ncbi:nephrin-like [Penaeus chinensis]|uniref:nephrin-like n=1 Tax=Penaeus chinensis TaxID=139456 RepID=UPI001FB77A24|nr:nephrin-like [Penaeus chinensis]